MQLDKSNLAISCIKRVLRVYSHLHCICLNMDAFNVTSNFFFSFAHQQLIISQISPPPLLHAHLCLCLFIAVMGRFVVSCTKSLRNNRCLSMYCHYRRGTKDWVQYCIHVLFMCVYGAFQFLAHEIKHALLAATRYILSFWAQEHEQPCAAWLLNSSL